MRAFQEAINAIGQMILNVEIAYINEVTNENDTNEMIVREWAIRDRLEDVTPEILRDIISKYKSEANTK